MGSKSNKSSLWDVPPIGAVLVRQPVLLEARPGGGRVGVVVRAELEVEEALVIGHYVDVHVDHLLGMGKLFHPVHCFTSSMSITID